MTIYHLATTEALIDLDNIAKPIMDALTRVVYFDDSQIDRLLIQRFEADDQDELANPSPEHADALLSGRPRIYIRLDDDRSRRAP